MSQSPAQWPQIPPRERIQRRYLPNVPLVTHEGRRVRFYDDLVKDRIVTINFMYAHCIGICVPTTANLLKVQKLLKPRVGRDIFMYSITLRPEVDSVDVLREHARLQGVRRGWTFLTGAPEDIELLRRKLGFTSPNAVEDTDKANHVGMIRFGNERLALWSVCMGTARPETIVRSVLSVARYSTTMK
jgi:protein SCO1